MVLSPGRTEPIEKYFETAADLAVRGFTVLVHDWRGQGLSQRLLADPLAGHAQGAEAFLADFQRLLTTFGGRLPRPWLALGHSMGGCLTLLALARGEDRFAAALLSAPMLGLQTGSAPPWAARALARLLCVVGQADHPAQKAGVGPEPFAGNILTHDAARFARNQSIVAATPELALGPPTWGWVDFAFAATRELQRGRGATRIRTPLTMVLAGEERLVDNAAARAVAARIPGARVIEIPGAAHEILQEADPVRSRFFEEFDALTSAAGAGSVGAKQR